jgi:hypothetical protein
MAPKATSPGEAGDARDPEVERIEADLERVLEKVSDVLEEG